MKGVQFPAGIQSFEDLTTRQAVQDSFRFFVRERKWIDEQHLSLCRIPAPTFQEQERAQYVAEKLRSFGLESRIDRAGNVLATLPDAGRQSPLVAVTAHLDTVLSPRTPNDIRVESKDRFLGPGVSDNGAGLAGLIALARTLTNGSGLDLGGASVLFVANVGEEGEGNLSGMRFLCRQPGIVSRIRSFLVLDGPATDHITSEALACKRYELTVLGPGGHSWSDHGVANPVHALARIIHWFNEGRLAEASAERFSYNFGVIEGGSTVNAIPTWARAKVDLRSTSPEYLQSLSNALTTTVERALMAENESSLAGRLTGRIRDAGSRPGGRLKDGAPILNYIRAVDRHLGIRSWADCASTDANIPLSLGLSAVSIGAGGQGGGAHTPAEWYSPEGRDLGLRRVLLALCLLLADASAHQAA